MAKRKRGEAKGGDNGAAGGASGDGLLLIGFDFDCTVTVRHFFKVIAHGYLKGDMSAHPHCDAFAAWCRDKRIPTKLGYVPQGLWSGNPMGAALEAFCLKATELGFRKMFREVFLGGEERIRFFADWLAHTKKAFGGRAEFAIVTAGNSATVLRALASAPELLHFFPSPMIWDTSQARHKTGSVMAMKALLLRDLRPSVHRIVLVDDSLEKDETPAWVLEAGGVEMFRGHLPYEGCGLQAESLAQLELMILGEGGAGVDGRTAEAGAAEGDAPEEACDVGDEDDLEDKMSEVHDEL